MPDLIGKTLGPYRITSQIDLGGMATVYKAYQPSMDRYVALKVLSTHLTQDPDFIKRFRQEAKIIAKLEHAHILPVYDHGEEDGFLYLVMRFIEAGTLKDRLRQGPLSLEEARRVVTQVGSALDHAHRLGIVHRDLKPSNVLIDPQGDCYLTDFGIAKMVEGTLALTGSSIIGTPHYMAPEQSQSRTVDHRADIYAMGIVVYEMLTGCVPFDAETPLAVVMKHLTEPLPLPRNLRPDLPEEVERVILKALAKDPADRYQNMRDLVTAFDDAVRAAAAQAPTVAAARAVPAPAPSEAQLTRATAPTVIAGRPGRLAALPRWLLPAVGGVLVVLIVGAILGRTLALGRTSRRQIQAATPTLAMPVAPPPTVAPASGLAADQARALAEPILKAITDKPPDYQDDFRNPGSGWWQTAPANMGKSGYLDGEFSMITSPPSPGWLCNAATGPMPKLADFVLEIDGRFVSGKAGSWQVHFRGWDKPAQGREGGYVLSSSEQRFSIMACADRDCRDLTEYSGSAVKRSTEWNHIQIIARGTRVAAYVNGEPAMYLDDGRYPVELNSGRFNLVLCNTSDVPLEARWDNLRIWDVSKVLGPVSPPAPNPVIAQARAFGEPILKAVTNKPPTFQDDFRDPRSGWPQVEATDRGKFGYVDAEYSVIANAARPEPVVCNGVIGPVRELGDFVLQVDGRFASGKGGDAMMTFRVWEQVAKGRGGYELHFSRPNETVTLRRCDSKGCPAVVDYFGNATKTSAEWNHWQIVAKGSKLAAYVNGEPILYWDDSRFTQDYGSGRLELTVCNAGDVPLDVRWDNLRIWDISTLALP